MPRFLAVLTVFLVSFRSTDANDPGATTKNEAAVRKAGVSYVAAFNRHDANALASFWSTEAVYSNRLTGEQVIGRAAIAGQFTAIFEAQKGLQLDVRIESIRFISPSVAVEHGVATLLRKEGEPDATRYSAVYIKHGEEWLLDRVTDTDVAAPASNYDYLKDLEWMIGHWVDEDDGSRIVTECKWTRNKNFITRSFTVSVEDRVDMAGMQIVGWDATSKSIRSWTFDSDGGFAEGAWTKKGDRWYIRKTGVMADGRKNSAVNIIKRVDDKELTLQSVERSVGGEILPNIDEITVVRSDGD